MHADCGRLSYNTSFKCIDCTNHRHQCFTCGRMEDDSRLLYCQHPTCHRFYHFTPDCSYYDVRKIDPGNFVCNLHYCNRCRKPAQPMNPLLSCSKCPTSYHRQCLPNDVQNANDYGFVCGKHFIPQKRLIPPAAPSKRVLEYEFVRPTGLPYHPMGQRPSRFSAPPSTSSSNANTRSPSPVPSVKNDKFPNFNLITFIKDQLSPEKLQERQRVSEEIKLRIR